MCSMEGFNMMQMYGLHSLGRKKSFTAQNGDFCHCQALRFSFCPPQFRFPSIARIQHSKRLPEMGNNRVLENNRAVI